MRSFVKIKSSRNAEITLSFTDICKSCPSRELSASQMCLLTLFAKIKFSRKFPDLQYIYSKACLKRLLKIDKTKILMTNGSLMKVESIECSPSAILLTCTKRYLVLKSKKGCKDLESIQSSTECTTPENQFWYFWCGRFTQLLLYY